MPVYMKYAEVCGDVTESTHSKWIEVNSFQWGVGRGISSPVGGVNDREATAPSVSEINITKTQDIASALLLDEALEGEGQDVTIDFCKTDKGKLSVFLTYTLNNTMISGYTLSSSGDRPQESLSLNFTKVQCTDWELISDNSEDGTTRVGYDLGLATVM
jgi:type VI secretion system secreted protein Hcp